MKSFVIKAEDLLKEYHIYDHPWERLKELFLKRAAHKVFRALGPLDIEVRRGETLGIIGENGAGKSTFLKIVAGVTEPSSGRITAEGKISSILELGTGFNPEFTGRENIYLNGALYGLSREEVSERMERIMQFADIGEFFDMPVKTYSSGMYMRLAFSLAVHVDADIILIDEVLTVGDGAYEKKCIDRIWDLKRNGTTLLYCSHSLYTVANFCDRVVWFKEGRVQGIGAPKDVISIYEDYLREREALEGREILAGRPDTEQKVAWIRNVAIFSGGKEAGSSVDHSSDVEVLVDFEIFTDAKVHVGFAVDRNDGLCCYGDSMHRQGLEPFSGPGRKNVRILFRNLPLLSGAYKFVIFLLDETSICLFDRRESAVVKVSTARKEWGLCYMDHEWKI